MIQHISIHALLAESDSERCRMLDLFVVFLSTLSLRRATSWHIHGFLYGLPFLSTLSLRRATHLKQFVVGDVMGISIHALLAESDVGGGVFFRAPSHISIHALLAESDSTSVQTRLVSISFLSTLSLRRATGHLQPIGRAPCISIHALLAESDIPETLVPRQNQNFYPRSPCGERQTTRSLFSSLFTFLSTLSLRRATGRGDTMNIDVTDFYPRSPCGERPRLDA